MIKRIVYLVPGFFGFTTIGSLNYFYRVKTTLQAALTKLGIEAEIVECRTQPTGSIPARAVQLLAEVVASGGLEADELHFVGHSTGGLDVRLLLTPGVALHPSDHEEQLGERTRSAISLSTPHYGTPLAGFFTTLQGRNVLRLLTVLATSREGRHAIFLTAQLTSLLAQVDDSLGRRNTLLDVVADKVLDKLTLDKTDPLWQFLERIAVDQGAVIHLTPEGMNLFNAAVTDRPGVRYLAAVSAAPRPSIGQAFANLPHVARATTYAVFSALHTLAAREHRLYRYPRPDEEQRQRLDNALGFATDGETNDGIVPSLSQLHGQLLCATRADHLDVVGQFRNAGGERYTDWLASGSGFDESRFAGLWASIAAAIAG